MGGAIRFDLIAETMICNCSVAVDLLAAVMIPCPQETGRAFIQHPSGLKMHYPGQLGGGITHLRPLEHIGISVFYGLLFAYPHTFGFAFAKLAFERFPSFFVKSHGPKGTG